MAVEKGSKLEKVTQYKATDMLPCYSNTVRIKVTEDNVYLDFGFVDPTQEGDAGATVVNRVLMNRSTFQTFSKHVAELGSDVKTKAGDISTVVMSRCPSQSVMR